MRSARILQVRQKFGEILLGSSSFSRKNILTKNGIPFKVIKPDVDEQSLGDRTKGADPIDLVTLLAKKKTEAILNTEANKLDLQNHRILLTADQVVTFQGNILEKPFDVEQARHFIRGYSENTCATVGCLVATDLRTKQMAFGIDNAVIHFKKIPDNVIETLLAEGTCMLCAGGLMVEHPLLEPYIASVDGSQESLMGLSCDLFLDLLEQLDI
jgi:septum formation protein